MELTDPSFAGEREGSDDAEATDAPQPLAPGGALDGVLRRCRRNLPAGTLLTMEGGENSALHVVLSGWLGVSKSLADGGRQIVDIVLRGGLVDPLSADGGTSAVQVETLSPAAVATVPSADWARLREADPALRRCQSFTAAAARSRISERMLRLGKGSAENRLAYALTEFNLRLSAIGESRDGAFHLPLTQQLLGEYLGLSSVHVCRTMRRLIDRGVIEPGDHMEINIRDPQSLATIAGVDIDILRSQIIPPR